MKHFIIICNPYNSFSIDEESKAHKRETGREMGLFNPIRISVSSPLHKRRRNENRAAAEGRGV